MDKRIKNFDVATVVPFNFQVTYLPGQVVSKTLAQNKAVSLTLFAFDKGEEISSHASGGDALVQILEGTAKITIDGIPHLVKAGEAILMPKEHPHALEAVEPFKMFLVVVF